MTQNGEMVPVDLHERIPYEDEMALNRVFEAMRMYRKIGPILRVIMQTHFRQRDLIKPYLMESLTARSDARQMKASDDWGAFWSRL